MILIFFLCLNLSILHLCVSDPGYQCKEVLLSWTCTHGYTSSYTFPVYADLFIEDCLTMRDDSSNNPKIFLIRDERTPPYNHYQEELNFNFRRLCSDYYDIKIGSLKDAVNHTNVIQFAVPDYYDGKPLENFVYAGNISKIDNAVCTKTNKTKKKKKKKTKPEFDCHEIVNLVSKSVLDINDGHVYDFVQSMTISEFRDRKSCEPYFPKTSDLTTVLLCLSEHVYKKKEVNIQPLELIKVFIADSAECSNYIYFHKNRLLAVLAPEPFGVLFEYSVPTIFYENPYLFSEYKTAFPNSMSLVPWQLLKYGFLKFIQTVGWQRVAIVTDDSEYSLEFEDKLTALFNKERIIYTVIRCEDANCEMHKIAEELRRVSARIVIANVEEKHAEYLFQHTRQQITWLVRDMVGYTDNKYLPSYQAAYSFSLRIDTQTNECGVEDNILTGLSSIAQAYKHIAKEDYKGNKFEFYRRFADKVKEVSPRITEATVVIHKLNGLEEISRISVNATGAKVISFKNPSVIQTDGLDNCLVSSYDYHNPCEEVLVMFLMLTLMVFMLTFLLILRYFDKNSPFNDIRYQNF